MDNPKHPKTWKTHSDLLDGLNRRGLIVDDRDEAINALQKYGYYRLSGYWYPFREATGDCCSLDADFKKPLKNKPPAPAKYDRFMPGATFRNAADLYVFDKRLRIATLDVLERIEIALRSDIAHLLGEKDRFAYLKPSLFHTKFQTELMPNGQTRYEAWLDNHAKLVARSKEEFIVHNKTRYGLPIPIWVCSEVWDFGTMSRLYDGMKEADQDNISRRYGIASGRIFASWLRSLNYLRNVCAHHSRLWNRNIVDQPKLPKVSQAPFVGPFLSDERLRARPFLLLFICKYLLAKINPNSNWKLRVIEVFEGSFPNLSHLNLTLDGVGVYNGWKEDWLK